MQSFRSVVGYGAFSFKVHPFRVTRKAYGRNDKMQAGKLTRQLKISKTALTFFRAVSNKAHSHLIILRRSRLTGELKVKQLFTLFTYFNTYIYNNGLYYIKCIFYRAFLEQVLHGTLMELSGTGDFQCLIDAVTVQKKRKEGLQDTILKYVTLVKLLLCGGFCLKLYSQLQRCVRVCRQTLHRSLICSGKKKVESAFVCYNVSCRTFAKRRK